MTFIDDKNWNNLVLTIDVSPADTGNSRWSADICPRVITPQKKICLGLSGIYDGFEEAYWYIDKEGSAGGHISKVAIEPPIRQSIHIKIEVKNGIYTSYINNLKINEVYDATFSSGSVGLRQRHNYWQDHYVRIAFDNLIVKPLED